MEEELSFEEMRKIVDITGKQQAWYLVELLSNQERIKKK